MLIKIGRATETAMVLLGIKQYPFTPKELTTCFRIAVKTNHPDNGGEHNKMIKVLEAYKTIKHLAINGGNGNGISIIEEMESDDIFEMFTDKECVSCEGTGEKYV